MAGGASPFLKCQLLQCFLGTGFRTALTPIFSTSASAGKDFSPSAPREDFPNTGPSLPALSSPHWGICGVAYLQG